MYGFHDLRRPHATYNFGRVDDRDLQRQMGHAAFSTTQGYIAFAEKVASEECDAFLPDQLLDRDGDVKTTSNDDS